MRICTKVLLFTLFSRSYGYVDDTKYDNKYNDGVEDYKSDDDNDKSNLYSYNDRDWKRDDKRYQDLNVVGLEKFDREDIYRPCAFDDWQCIRKFFATNSKCNPMYGPVPDPLYFERNTAYYPSVNLTVIFTRLRVKGLGSSKITEFYVNKDTGNLVLAINFKDLNETTPNAFFRYKRTAKESIVLNDFVTHQFSSGTFTAVIPKVPHLKLDLAEIHVDIDDAFPPFFVGPKAYTSTDPDVTAAFAKLLANVPTAIQEEFLLKAQLLMSIYIQKNICDFGLNIISV